MKYKELLIELINYLDAFERMYDQSETQPSIKDFADFLRWRSEKRDSNKAEDSGKRRDISKDVARHISLMHRYSRFYFKKALQGSDLQTEDEYTYLVCLMTADSMTKTELNNMNAMEKTSGAEIMRRLTKNGLIAQKPNEEDRRSMKVYITDKGRSVLKQLFPRLHLCANLLVSPLSEEQLQVYNHLQDLLSKYHGDVFVNRRNADLADLHAEIYPNQPLLPPMSKD